MKDYEEKTSFNNKWGWVSLFLLSFFVFGWAMVLMFTVKDVPRKWDYGSVKDAPAENIYTTNEYEKYQKDIQQIEPVPDINEKENPQENFESKQEEVHEKSPLKKDSVKTEKSNND